jgi:hypothetical protein
MLLDVQNILSDQQNLAQAIGSYNSTNVMDMWGQATKPNIPQTIGLSYQPGQVIKDAGRGALFHIFCEVLQAFTSGGAGTLQAQIINADDAALTVNPTVNNETSVLALATLVVGYQLRLNPQPGLLQRYVGVKYTIAGAAMTAGIITAGIAWDPQTSGFIG